MSADYIVIRDPDCEAVNGKWFDRSAWTASFMPAEQRERITEEVA